MIVTKKTTVSEPIITYVVELSEAEADAMSWASLFGARSNNEASQRAAYLASTVLNDFDDELSKAGHFYRSIAEA